MADINDTNNTLGKLANEWDLLDEAAIDDDDREAIRQFVEYRRDLKDKAANTLISDLGNLRRASARADVDLLEMDRSGVRRFVGKLTTSKDMGGFGLKPDGGGMFGYRRALRVFFNWLDDEPEYGEYGFGDVLDLPTRDTEEDTISEDDLLTEWEVEALKDATNSDRDRVLVDFLADVGARISLATSLRVGDIKNLDTPEPAFRPNMSAVGLKGVEDRRYPIMYSRAELREWVNRQHPDPQPDAPLFPVNRGYDPDNPEQCAASGDTIRDRLNEAADRAGLDTNVHPHHFRHVFMTRISNSDLNQRELEHMSLLTDDQMRMLDRYDHTTDRERNRGAFEKFGFIDPDAETDDGRETPKLITCPNCRADDIKSTSTYCPQCSAVLQPDLRKHVDDADDALTGFMVDTEKRRKRLAASDIAAAIASDAETADAVIQELEAFKEDG